MAQLKSQVPNQLYDWFKDEFTTTQFIASLNTTFVLYLLQLIVNLSFVALVFSGSLSVYYRQAIPFIIGGNALILALVALFSTFRGSIAITQDGPAVIMALAVASVAPALPPGISDGARFSTILILIAASTLVMSVIYLLLGFFKLGGLARFLPYPVMGGFLAGTGWLLTIGGVGVATDVPFGLDLLQPDQFPKVFATVAVGFGIFMIEKRWKSPLISTAILSATMVAFYAIISISSLPSDLLLAKGWLFQPYRQGLTWFFPFMPETLSLVDWSSLAAAVPVVAPAFLISVVGLLLNASGLELITRQDLDLNRELIINGYGNLLVGLTGGMIGYTAISPSTLNLAMSKGRRLPGLLASALLVLTLVFGANLISWIPRFLLGGLLVYIGISMLDSWLIRGWSAFPRIDFAIILTILVVIALYGFLWGIGVGLVLTVIMFVISYSRISVIRYELSGTNYHSRVNRSLRQWKLLEDKGEQLLILKLQGFVFFGTATSLLERIRDRFRKSDLPRPSYILLDFSQVTGMDSSGLLSFNKLYQFVHENNLELIFSTLPKLIHEQFTHGGLGSEKPGLRLFPDLDRAVEWCEDQIIQLSDSDKSTQDTLHDQLLTIVSDQTLIAELIQNLRRRQVSPGEYIIRQGDEPDALYFIESGQLSIQNSTPGREPVRLESIRGGRMVGELGFFLNTLRNASIVADEPSIVYYLTREDWNRIKAEIPEVAQILNDLTIRMLAQRIGQLTRIVDFHQ